MPAQDALDERSPLLQENDGLGKQVKKPTPLLKGQIAILMLLCLAKPITSHCIFPFINQLIREFDITGGDEKKVGYYAGMIESIFFAVEALFVFQWSRLSDHIVRKPVLLVGVGGLWISMICFGLSKTFLGLVVSRSLVGLLNTNTGITDETNIAQGFAWLPVAWSVGSTIGPLIGGQLAKPHDRWPTLFTHPFWVKYPYFLPCAASASFSAFTFLITALFLKEFGSASLTTLHSLHRELRRARPLEIAYLALQPLFFSTPIELGGLGLAPPTIGVILGTFGVLNGLFQALVLARLMDLWGPKRLFQQGLLTLVPLYLLFPLMSLYAKAHGITRAIWALVFFQQGLLIIVDLAFGAIFMRDGVAQFIASVVRAVGPGASTSLFATSLERNWLGEYGVYPILLSMTLALFFVSTPLPRNMWPKIDNCGGWSRGGFDLDAIHDLYQSRAVLRRGYDFRLGQPP
ncbi:major facilitator superfamily domain-containing protein [Trametes punicea]|nr:major facilitator superfamily domain-containing protein [Trametes punicea]